MVGLDSNQVLWVMTQHATVTLTQTLAYNSAFPLSLITFFCIVYFFITSLYKNVTKNLNLYKLFSPAADSSTTTLSTLLQSRIKDRV